MAASGLLLGACGQDIAPADPRNLDRPTDVVFVCVGDTVINPGTPDETIAFTAQPMSLCQAWADFEATQGNTNPDDRLPPPEGQEAVESSPFLPEMHAFVVQPGKGTLAMIRPSVFSVIDTDPLTPGRNAISVGTLPVDGVADDTGCFAVTANAGSCDLSVLDATSAVNTLTVPTIGRTAVVNAAGDAVDAKPRAIAVGPQRGQFGVQCPAEPQGVAYVAYPDCNLVAAVDLATGEIQAGVQFDEAGNPRIVDGDVQCLSQCGGGNDMSPLPDLDAGVGADAGVDGGMPDPPPPPPPPPADGAPRPVTLTVDPSGTTLYIGAENSNAITVVDLDAARLPQATTTIGLEGDVGVNRIKVTGPLQMGGDSGGPGGNAGTFRFGYAIASDRTIRVVDLDAEVECDTQVDPRFIYNEADIGFLQCMAVGDPQTPPRRAGARSPGIPTPRDSVPLDIAFATLGGPGMSDGIANPTDMVGTFGFLTTSDGFVHIINIDDDDYRDREVGIESTFVSLAIPHQLRDFVLRDPSLTNATLAPDVLRDACLFPDPSEAILNPRLGEGVGQILGFEELAPEKIHEAPFPLGIECPMREGGELTGDVSFVTELAFAAPEALRELVFPDLRQLRNEQWFIVWEGPLSLDSAIEDIDGPAVRNGVLRRSGNSLSLQDPTGSLCELGAEPFDIFLAVGCDPTGGDAQCGLGETCFVHPDAPANVTQGTCLPEGDTDILGGSCREYLISRKRFTVTTTRAGEASLVPRRRVLDTTPVEGCTSSAECVDMARLDRVLELGAHPIAADPGEDPFTWVCEPDPTRAPGPDKCLMTCEVSEDCEAGRSCLGGYCVEAPLPPASCVGAVQRYQIRAGEAFAVVGDATGYLHNRIADASGQCIDDPNGNPLNVGRIPLDAPDCPEQAIDTVTPNPCRVTLTQHERFADLVPQNGQCVARDPAAGLEPRERQTHAIRFSNPGFTFHVADVVTSGDADCIDDRAGTFPLYSAVHDSYQLRLVLTGGFIPMFVGGIELRFPISITLAPDGSLWVLDQGDASSTIRGRVLTLQPGAAATGNFGAIQFL
jgi:DNA-binding beta-propeller fold protein YncE